LANLDGRRLADLIEAVCLIWTVIWSLDRCNIATWFEIQSPGSNLSTGSGLDGGTPLPRSSAVTCAEARPGSATEAISLGMMCLSGSLRSFKRLQRSGRPHKQWGYFDRAMVCLQFYFCDQVRGPRLSLIDGPSGLSRRAASWEREHHPPWDVATSMAGHGVT